MDTPFWRHAANYTGHSPRMVMMDPPGKVVNAVIRKSLRPEKELAVGWKAKSAKLSHRILPHLTERISANLVELSQMEHGPPVPNTSGSLHKPMEAGRGVDDGVKAA